MKPMNFAAANENCNCYSYDARKLDEAKCVQKDHLSAVMDIDYPPTGREFVTESYDRTVRIFLYNGGHSREIYHRVLCAKFSRDASYVISGSDDTNLRLWKAKASEQLGVILPRECKKHETFLRSNAFAETNIHDTTYKAGILRRTMADAEKREEDRRRAHSAPGSMPRKSRRKNRIVKEIE
ncbi:nucleotide binding,protein binding protein [Artemisia annua]|uniref:Nucleotide binding,protein binding protein n=1 Tax=Artemisia annua TaxID=35608 RepID=A0A2U1PTK6_ARTAN|nr:nucleotide binding,protein binding protein [Artemisia annua]